MRGARASVRHSVANSASGKDNGERQYSVRLIIPVGEKAQVRIQRYFVPLRPHAQAHAHIRLGQRRGQRTPAARFQPADTDIGKRAVDPKCQIAADPVVALEYLVQVFSPLEAEFPGQRIVRRYAGIAQHELQPLAAGLGASPRSSLDVLVHRFDVEIIASIKEREQAGSLFPFVQT